LAKVRPTMEKHAADIFRVMDCAEVGRAPLIGVSIGGYALFEFWRKHRGRVSALGLCNTKAPADAPEARAARLHAANDVMERGTEPFFESMIPRLLGKSTRELRPDLVEGALRMMRQMSPADVAQVQRGMAERPDSVDTLKTINVPTLLVTGEEDLLTGINEPELMRQHIPNSQLRVIPKSRALLGVGAAGRKPASWCGNSCTELLVNGVQFFCPNYESLLLEDECQSPV